MIIPAPHDPDEIHDEQWAGWDGKVGWDVGANVGQSVPDMVLRFDVVHAFEPSDEAFAALSGEWQMPGVFMHQIALAGHDGMLGAAVREAPIQSGQLVAADMPYKGEDHGQNTAVWGAEQGIREVPCRSADSFAAENGYPDFVKVDTEGHEVVVLSGASGILARQRTGWLVEFHTEDRGDECLRLLTEAGYSPQVLRHPHYAPGSSMWRQHGWIRAVAPCEEASQTD